MYYSGHPNVHYKDSSKNVTVCLTPSPCQAHFTLIIEASKASECSWFQVPVHSLQNVGAMLCLYLYAICLPPRIFYVVHASNSTVFPLGREA